MSVAEPNKDVAVGSWSPSGQLVAICDTFVESIRGTKERVHIGEALAGVLCASEEVMRAQTSGGIRHCVVERDSMAYSKGPQLGVGSFGPMNGRVKEHSTGPTHDGLDGTFSYPVVVVCTCASKTETLV
jgi:hypothetical protein